MNRSEQINELATALAKAQGEITGAIRDSTNPHFRSKYADLSSVWEAIRSPFAKHGLAVVQGLSSTETGVRCETMLIHSGGQWISESLTIPADKANAHGYGSAATYARRFGLQAIAGIAPIDDDGNAAVAAKPDVDRTMVAKISKAIGEHVAAERDFGALGEWQEAVAWSEELASEVWARLPTKEREVIRKLQTERAAKEKA